MRYTRRTSQYVAVDVLATLCKPLLQRQLLQRQLLGPLVGDGDAGDEEDERVGEVAERLPKLVQKVEDLR